MRSTEAERWPTLSKNAVRAHQAKLIGARYQKLERRKFGEAAIALFNMLPADAAGLPLASLGRSAAIVLIEF